MLKIEYIEQRREMADLLARAEYADAYRAAVAASSLNREARAGQLYEVGNVSPADAQRIEETAASIPLVADCDIVILHPSADGGFPHTRPQKTICLPAEALSQLANTLIHESIHVEQRRDPQTWESVCQKEGWTRLDTPFVPRAWRERCRINPDTMATPFWAWDGVHVPLPLFRESPKSLADVDILWWDRRMSTLFHSPPPSFQARYGRYPSQPEHPYELLAVEVAQKGITDRTALYTYLASL